MSGKDLGKASSDLRKFQDGSYFYQLDDQRFDVDKFNRDFEQYVRKRKDEQKRKLDDKLAQLNEPEPETLIYNKSIGNIFIDAKDSMFKFLDDLLQRKFTLDTFTKDNRLFYIGLVIVVIAVVIFLYNILAGDDKQETSKPVFEIKHIHEIINNQIKLQNGANPE